jgi:hypothetical protein
MQYHIKYYKKNIINDFVIYKKGSEYNGLFYMIKTITNLLKCDIENSDIFNYYYIKK